MRFTEEPLAIHIENATGRLIQRFGLDRTSHDVSFLLPEGPLLGMGEGGPQFDRKGSVDEMINGQRGYRLRTHGGRVPMQWLVGTDGWGMYLHQPLGTFDFTGAEGRMLVDATGDVVPLDVFLIASDGPPTILGEYARLTGYAEMPARWTFGYQQSHRTLQGPAEIRWVAETLREKKLPCDTLIYLGTEFTPSGWNTRNGEFTFHPENFPEPAKQIEELHDRNFIVVLHIVIEGERLTGTVDDACVVPEPSGRDANDEWPDERHVGCYWPYHESLMDLGVDGFWPDQGGIHVAVDHLAATPLGQWVDVEVTVVEVDGRKVELRASVRDAVEEVGRGEHVRFVIDVDRHRKRLEKKLERFADSSK